MIPQTDPKAGYLAQKAEIDAAIARVLDSGWYILGQEVRAFEAEFAHFAEARHAIGVANGTDGLVLALRALDVGPGDGVVTVSHTAVATVAAVELVGAIPILADIDPRSFTLRPDSLEAAISAAPIRPVAVVPVHLYGHPADMPAILSIARAHGLKVLEDCSQSHGARLAGTQVGGFGDLAAYSLYPTKNLGAIGDGGIVTTNDDALADRLRALREYGWKQRYISDDRGMNSRLDELQAAILRAKLGRLDAMNEARRRIAAVYDNALDGLPFARPPVAAGARHVYHQYVLRVRQRDRLKEYLKDQGVGTNIHYPMPVHLQPAYANRIALPPGGLPDTERASREVLSLPMYPELAAADVERTVAALRAAADAGID